MASTLSSALFGAYLFASDAPNRVHLVRGVMVLLAIWLPGALCAEGRLARRWAPRLLTYFVIVTVLNDYLTSSVVSKVDFGTAWWPQYPLVFVAVVLVFVVCTTLNEGYKAIAYRRRAA